MCRYLMRCLDVWPERPDPLYPCYRTKEMPTKKGKNRKVGYKNRSEIWSTTINLDSPCVFQAEPACVANLIREKKGFLNGHLDSLAGDGERPVARGNRLLSGIRAKISGMKKGKGR